MSVIVSLRSDLPFVLILVIVRDEAARRTAELSYSHPHNSKADSRAPYCYLKAHFGKAAGARSDESLVTLSEAKGLAL
jgi:hypothetical protein